MSSVDSNLTYSGEVLAISPWVYFKGFSDTYSTTETVRDRRDVAVGDIIFFDQFAHRTFEYGEQKDKYTVVNIEKGLWGYLIKNDNGTTTGNLRDEGVSAPLSPLPDVPLGN